MQDIIVQGAKDIAKHKLLAHLHIFSALVEEGIMVQVPYTLTQDVSMLSSSMVGSVAPIY